MLTIHVCSQTSEITALFNYLIGLPNSLIIFIAAAFSATGKAPDVATVTVIFLSLECSAKTRRFLKKYELEGLWERNWT